MNRLSAILLGVALLGTACAASDARYQRNDLQLITAYTAKELCSCLFVMEHSEDYCRAWTRASPAVADAAVDHEAKVVTSSAVLLWSARARWVDARSGCVLDAL